MSAKTPSGKLPIDGHVQLQPRLPGNLHELSLVLDLGLRSSPSQLFYLALLEHMKLAEVALSGEKEQKYACLASKPPEYRRWCGAQHLPSSLCCYQTSF